MDTSWTVTQLTYLESTINYQRIKSVLRARTAQITARLKLIRTNVSMSLKTR